MAVVRWYPSILRHTIEYSCMPLSVSIHRLLRRFGRAFNANLEDRLSALEVQIGAIRAEMKNRDSHGLDPLQPEMRDFLTHQTVRQVSVETSDYVTANPELGLMEFLYSHLPGRKALDIGAHSGEVSGYLLQAGYEVTAFEPCPESYARLMVRLGHVPGFRAFQIALGDSSGEALLHVAQDSTPSGVYDDASVFNSLAPHPMPEGLAFTQTIPVQTRRLADLHKEGLIPEGVSLVKIDTEGNDLEVIRGMGAWRYPVVLAEFWDAALPFASPGSVYQLGNIAQEMRSRDYFWFIVIYRIWGQEHTGFFCNHCRSVPMSWGNVVFFRNREIFEQAQHWCAAVLPRTYFKPAPKTS